MNDSLRDHVDLITKLPSIPTIAQEILGLVDDDTVSAARLETIIRKDPSISARIMSVANSAFFGSRNPATTIGDAIVRIGFNNVKNIAIGISIMTVLYDTNKEHAFYYQRIYKHSALVGLVSRSIAKDLGLKIHEEILINGLLHDIGQLVQNKYFPEEHLNVFAESGGKTSYLDAEKKVFGYFHTDIGAWLVEKWKLPASVHDSTLYHHNPSGADHNREHVAVVHMADFITTKNLYSVSKSDPGYPFDPRSLEMLGIGGDRMSEIESNIINNTPADDLFN